MLGHGAKFEQKMEQAIAALLSHRNVEVAARSVGISVNTLQRWMQVPEFQAAYQAARRKLLSQAIGRLQDAAGAAATTLLKIMMDPNVPAGVRLRAAEVVLDQVVKAGEVEEFEDRMAKLEWLAGLKSRKRSADLSCLTATPLPDPAKTPAQIAAGPSETAETDSDVDE